MISADTNTIALGLQLGASALMMVLLTLVHALGLMAISRALRLNSDRLEEKSFDLRAIGLTSVMALLVFVLHSIEIWIFAGFYLLVGAMQSLEEALYYSAAAYATLGRTAEYFPDDWRILGAIEALIGFVLIGWSTAFLVKKLNQLQP